MNFVRVWGCWVIAPVLITFVHEVGHLLVAAALGARPLAIMVGPFGGGYVRYDSAVLGPSGTVLAASGGMLLNLVSGILLLLASRTLPAGSLRAAAGAIAGGLSLVVVPGYLFLGLDRQVGDPAIIARTLVPDFFSADGPAHFRTFLIALSAVTLLVATWVCARAFLRHQLCVWPGPSGRKRVVLAAALTAPLVIVFALRAAVFDSSGLGHQVFSDGPGDAVALLAELEKTEPEVTGAARFERAAQILRARRVQGLVDDRPRLALMPVAMLIAMTLIAAITVCRYPAV